ncbi:hypothetical protein [Chitinolyticbacter albus]|uniref:hypothetical protein n=1 Tax=Chitinolyticbacter albus TaxID=2961951 RepID=UPI00210BAB3C|nr:hypothetical protein [Chitinolyticbacter albus]
MRIFVLVVFLSCISISAFADDPLKTLWTSFYQSARYAKFDEPVKIYETDSDYKTMCFIYKKNVWFFKDGKITRAEPAKVFNVDGINRIGYAKSKGGGVFTLWSNEELVISFGA